MENKIIPTLFALDKKEFEEKLEKINFSNKIHIDFMNKDFVENNSVMFVDMKKILDYTNIYFEIHLMAKNPIQYLSQIKHLNIKKVLIQEEVFMNKEEIERTIRNFKENNLEVFIVLNPDTKIDRIKSLLEIIDGIMVMSVWPGAEGQKFIENSISKIKEIRDFVGEGYPIQIDGGVKKENICAIIDSSTQILSVGSEISSSNSPRKKYLELKKLIIS